MDAELAQAVQYVVSTCPAKHRHGKWLFLRRHDGGYMVALLGYDEQAVETTSGPAFKICTPPGLAKAVEEIERMITEIVPIKAFDIEGGEGQ
jgi:hypothetical protein